MKEGIRSEPAVGSQKLCQETLHMPDKLSHVPKKRMQVQETWRLLFSSFLGSILRSLIRNKSEPNKIHRSPKLVLFWMWPIFLFRFTIYHQKRLHKRLKDYCRKDPQSFAPSFRKYTCQESGRQNKHAEIQ